MTQYAVVRPFDGQILGLTGTMGPPGDGRLYMPLVEELAGVPDPPFPGAVWSWRDGPYWHDPRSVDEARADRWAAIKERRHELDNAPFQHGGFSVDADVGSRTDVMGALMAMQLTGQTSRLWRCADNIMRELTLADLIAIGTGIAARRQALIETSDALYQQMQTAQTAEAVNAVGWPEP
jgi:hypothetical protein